MEHNSVEVYVSFLRRKLTYLHSKVSIKAIRNMGYILEFKDGEFDKVSLDILGINQDHNPQEDDKDKNSLVGNEVKFNISDAIMN